MRKTYLVADGVGHINGAAVPADRKVELTEAEALFDLSLGRVWLKTTARAQKALPAKSESDAD